MVEAIEKKQFNGAIDELAKKTPAPMNTMLTKQSREEAIEKRKKRDTMQLVDIPPTNQVCETAHIKQHCYENIFN